MAKPNTNQRAVAAAIDLAVVVVVIVTTMAALGVATTAAGARGVPPVYIRVDCTEVHGVGAGETCESVARDARLTLPSFMDLNPNVTCGALFPGQWVCVRGVTVA